MIDVLSWRQREREAKRQRQLRIALAIVHDELLMQLAIYNFWFDVARSVSKGNKEDQWTTRP